MCCLRKIKGCRLAEKPGDKREQFRSQDTFGTFAGGREPFCVYVFMVMSLKINAIEIVNICYCQGTC